MKSNAIILDRMIDLLANADECRKLGLPEEDPTALALDAVYRTGGNYRGAVDLCRHFVENKQREFAAVRCLAALTGERIDKAEERAIPTNPEPQPKDTRAMPFIELVNLPELKEIPTPEYVATEERATIQELNEAASEINSNTEALATIVDSVTREPWVHASDPAAIVETMEWARLERIKHYAAFWMYCQRRFHALSNLVEAWHERGIVVERDAIMAQLSRGQELIDAGYSPDAVHSLMQGKHHEERKHGENLRTFAGQTSRVLQYELEAVDATAREIRAAQVAP